MTEARDNAGVIAPPPLLALAVVVIGLALDWLLPAYVLSVLLSLEDRIVIGVILIAAGLGLAISALGLFKLAKTHAEPWKPSTALVTEGIFKWLRNPMYVGVTSILVGLSILLASDWMLVMTIVFVPVIHFGVIKREERYLTVKFGETVSAIYSESPALRLAVLSATERLSQTNVQAFPGFVHLPVRKPARIGK